eukprot:TRINITY_DN33044_c0_g1_i1.p2 TRINITY_DN33044_c0_g1~~TRINITY_DN33044_c0_g1_i1.p2  ORF type:complete len:409 (+),score=50.36 TRINITY_DN33044_c0_g1_i1:48-1229(+)
MPLECARSSTVPDVGVRLDPASRPAERRHSAPAGTVAADDDIGGSSPPRRSSVSVAVDEDCSICLDSVPAGGWVRVGRCPAHRFCATCVAEHVRHRIMDRGASRAEDLWCPGCPRGLPSTAVPDGDAEVAILLRPAADAAVTFGRFRELAALQTEAGPPQLPAELRGTVRQCPRCRVMTGRVGGCEKMYCSHCGAEWCWGCEQLVGAGLHLCPSAARSAVMLSDNIPLPLRVCEGFGAVTGWIFAAVCCAVLACAVGVAVGPVVAALTICRRPWRDCVDSTAILFVGMPVLTLGLFFGLAWGFTVLPLAVTATAAAEVSARCRGQRLPPRKKLLIAVCGAALRSIAAATVFAIREDRRPASDKPARASELHQPLLTTTDADGDEEIAISVADP